MRIGLIAFFIAICFMASAAPKLPELTGRVIDDADIISTDARQSLDNELKQHEEQTTNQVVVVTVPSLQHYSVEDFSVALARHWAIGQKGKNNGVVMLVAPKERKVRIEVGYGLEGTLTDVKSKQIIDDIILPEFRSGDMESGITSGVDSIISVLNGGDINTGSVTFTPSPQAQKVKPMPKILAHIYGLLLNILFIVVVSVIFSIIHFIISGTVFLFYKLIGKPLPTRFTSDNFAKKNEWHKMLYLSQGFYSSGSSGGSGFSSGDGGFSGGGGSFGGGGASGSW